MTAPSSLPPSGPSPSPDAPADLTPYIAGMALLTDTLIVILTASIMEAVAWGTHRYVMHGAGWGWHRSHHEPREGAFELNDLYAVVFALLSMLLIYAGSRGWWPGIPLGLGMTLYGLLYFVVHDGLVHQRWPFRHTPRNAYLRRLVQAHKMHHAVEGREGCVSFGFIYAPPIRRLKAELQASRAARLRAPQAADEGRSNSLAREAGRAPISPEA